MKKKLISAAILLGASSMAFAASDVAPMSLNPDGLGQVLLYPYYNVNDGFDTAFTVVNTSNTYRAVKVRIVEGKNSWEILDFNVYMSPYDTWQGMIHKDDDEIKILTSDTSCTAPILNNPKKPAVARMHNLTNVEGAQMRPVSLNTGKRYKNRADEIEAEYADPATILKRMSEGYIEVIDMGAVFNPSTVEVTNDNAARFASITGTTAENSVDGLKALKKEWAEGQFNDSEKTPGDFYLLLNAITHNPETGEPGNCAYLSSFSKKYWQPKDKTPDIGIYSDGGNYLSGSATLINVGKGEAGSYNAVAIKYFANDEAKKVDGDKVVVNEAARDYSAGYDKIAYTLHNLPGASYPNLNGQVQRGKEILYAENIAQNALINYNGGGMKHSLPVNTATYDNVEPATPSKTDFLHNYGVLEGTGDYTTEGSIENPAFPAAVTLSAILMAKDVIGEYVIDPDLRAATDWIITMPTKHYFTNPNTTDLSDDYTGIGQYGFINDTDSDIMGNDDKRDWPRWLRHRVKAYNPFSNTAFSATPLVEIADIVTFNREEAQSTVSYEFDFSPSLGVPKTGMNSEANVLHFSKDETKKIFSSMNEHMMGLKKDFISGWAKISFNDQFLSNKVIDLKKFDESCAVGGSIAAKDDFCLRGLPVVGVAVTKYVNSILYIDGTGDVLSNYMGIVDLTYNRDNEVKTTD